MPHHRIERATGIGININLYWFAINVSLNILGTMQYNYTKTEMKLSDVLVGTVHILNFYPFSVSLMTNLLQGETSHDTDFNAD